MEIKVYGHPISIAAQRAVLSIEEKGLEYEYVHIDLFTGQQKKEPLISINPFGQVPGFEDGDLKLFESRAITKYIAHAYADKGTPLLDHDPKKMAIIGLWMEVESQKFDASASKLNYEVVIKPIKGMTSDEAVAEELKGQLGSVLDIYEARLAVCKYLGGDDYSLADLHHIPLINNLMKTKYKDVFEDRPNVKAWCANILGRPATQKVLGPKA